MATGEARNSRIASTALKVATTISASVIALVHIFRPDYTIDSTLLWLFAIALLPWALNWLESIEIAGVGKLALRKKVEEVEAEQKEQKKEQSRQKEEQRQQKEILDSLAFLIQLAVTDDELSHLKKLESGADFPFIRDDSTSFFEAELRRLRAGRLIAGRDGKGIRTMYDEGGQVRTHFDITERGRRYLALRERVEQQTRASEASKFDER